VTGGASARGGRRPAAHLGRHVIQLVCGSARIVSAAIRSPPAPGRTPLVSIVIATYNWSSVLRYAIESVLRQSYSNWELIVVGDGCTDDSEAVVRSFADPRIRWTNLPENTGSQSAPNNAGIALAKGEYVAYHGHDDLWLPDHLIRLVGALERSGAGIASTAYETVGPPGSNFRVIPFLVYSGSFANRSTPSSVLHRRASVAATAAGATTGRSSSRRTASSSTVWLPLTAPSPCRP
jgi:glycosyltransferase involved in cell wall biosynthesis